MPIVRWEFDLPQPDRLPNLESETSIEAITTDIVRRIREGAQLCCHKEDFGDFQVAGREGTKQFRRIVYCITVDRPPFDRFYNSRYGYRAAYFRDPLEGLRANHLLLKSVAPALIESQATFDSGVGQTFIQESLTSLSAKAWLAEKDKGLCECCTGEWSGETARSAEIRNNRWEIADSFSRWGSAAPYFTRIKLCGAWLRESTAKGVIDGYEEEIAAVKRYRAFEIHKCGWS